MLINAVELQEWLLRFVGVFARVGAALLVAPVFGAGVVPRRIRVVVALVVTLMIMGVVPGSTGSAAALRPLQLFQEIALGVAIGFIVQTAFDVLIVAGQLIGLTMGLGFANLIDPQHGVSVPVVGQLYLLLALLVFVSLDGHIAFVSMLADSYRSMPAGQGALARDDVAAIVTWGGRMFSGALQVALPAVIAMTVVNVAFGIMSRAAPQLNLFGVGFPITIVLGFIALWLGLSTLTGSFGAVLNDAMELAARLARGSG